MDNKKIPPATQQPLSQQYYMAHHVHTNQVYPQQYHQVPSRLPSSQLNYIQPDSMRQLAHDHQHYQPSLNARSPLLDEKRDTYGTGYGHDFNMRFPNEIYKSPQTTIKNEQVLNQAHADYNVEQPMNASYVATSYDGDIYQDYTKRNAPVEASKFHQHQHGLSDSLHSQQPKLYLPYPNRTSSNSNTELLRKQYNEIQQMKLKQQMQFQNQAQMYQQQTFAERQLLLQQIHGVQPPHNLQNNMYIDEPYRELDDQNNSKHLNYSGGMRNDTDKIYDYNFPNLQKREVGNNMMNPQWKSNQAMPVNEKDNYGLQPQEKRNIYKQNDLMDQKKGDINSPVKSSDSSSPSIKSPSSESRRSSGNQALRSPIALRSPNAPVTLTGTLYKQGSDGLKVWRKRWFVLSEYCLFYYKNQEEEKLLGSVLLPSYKVSPCTSEDKIMRKYAFKLQHTNMRTYILAAADQGTMFKWVKALAMATLMQNSNDYLKDTSPNNQVFDHVPGKVEDDELPGPTYVNAPPKPRRSNDGYNSPTNEIYSNDQDGLNALYGNNPYKVSTEKQIVISPSHGQTKSLNYNPTRRSCNTQNLSLPLNETFTHGNGDASINTSNTQILTNSDKNNLTQLSYSHYNMDEIKALQNTASNNLSHNPNVLREKNENYFIENKNDQKRDVYGQLNFNSSANDYKRPQLPLMQPEKIGDYEDVYTSYYKRNNNGLNSKKETRYRNENISETQKVQHSLGNHAPEKTFSGPSILRKKKMQLSGIQPPIPRPHSADFLEYESKHESFDRSILPITAKETKRQPQRPKSSLDMKYNFDSSSDNYYSEESYAEKMRQSSQYLQAGLAQRNIQIPLAKYASGLAEKQLCSPYSEKVSYEAELGNKNDTLCIGESYQHNKTESMNSNWTLREKDLNNGKDFPQRCDSVVSDESNNIYGKKYNNIDAFTRSASARLPTTVSENEGEKKVQQREESMKRLLEWKQRMLQSPLTRKSTPAAISLSQSLIQNKPVPKSKTDSHSLYNSFSSDDEASTTISGMNMEPYKDKTTEKQSLQNKNFLGSSTSIGKMNRDTNIPIRAVSPRVRWAEDKAVEQYSCQQVYNSTHNLTATEESWANTRLNASRISQQPIRAVSPRIRTNNTDDTRKIVKQSERVDNSYEIPTAGQLLGRTHEELVLLLIQLRRRHAATHRAMDNCRNQINTLEESLGSVRQTEREESLRKLEQLKIQLMELEHQYEKSEPLVKLVDNMVKLGSLYNKPSSTMDRLERNQKLRQKVLTEYAMEQQRWLENAAAGNPLATEAARVRAGELWALEQELADEANLLRGLKSDKETIESLVTGVRDRYNPPRDGPKEDIQDRNNINGNGMEAELARVHAMLALNSKKLEQTVADNARLERELQQLRQALQSRRTAPAHPAHPAHAPYPTALLEDEVQRVQQLVTALQRQRQELSRTVRMLTHHSSSLRSSQPQSPEDPRQALWMETNLDTGLGDGTRGLEPGLRDVISPLYVDTRIANDEHALQSTEDLYGYGNIFNGEKPEIKTVRIVKRESERRQRDKERSLHPMSDWTNSLSANMDQFLEEELIQPTSHRASSLPRTGYSNYQDGQCRTIDTPNYLHINNRTSADLSPKYLSSPSLSNYDYSRGVSSMSSSYHQNYDRQVYDRSITTSTQYLNSSTNSSRTLINEPMSKTSSIVSLNKSGIEINPVFKSEAAKQIITEMSGDGKNGSSHRRAVPKEKRRHNTAPHHYSTRTLNEMPPEEYMNEKVCRSLDDADLAVAVRGAAPDVVRSALRPAPAPAASAIDSLLAAPQKILIPERYVPEKPPELSPEEQQKRLEKVESIKKMLSSSTSDPSKSPDAEERKQREHLLQMNQILAKQVTEMSKIIAGTNIEQGPPNIDN